jgi:3-oxoacyl-[acyl-carrier-protein] synthase-3
MVQMIINQLKLDPAKAPFNVADYGNTVSSSIPILLEKELDNVDIKSLVICGFGVGLSWASGILFRVK